MSLHTESVRNEVVDAAYDRISDENEREIRTVNVEDGNTGGFWVEIVYGGMNSLHTACLPDFGDIGWSIRQEDGLVFSARCYVNQSAAERLWGDSDE